MIVKLVQIVLLLNLYNLASSTTTPHPDPWSDASPLLEFKSKADVTHKLPFSPNTSSELCKWEGVQCHQGKVIRLIIQGLNLGGVFAPNTLTRLHQLRSLSLQNNSLNGPIPDLSDLLNLKALFLDHNFFSSSIPPSLSTLHRLRIIDLSYNNLIGFIPQSLTNLRRLYILRLHSNRLTGSIPPLNQSSLQIFNVSINNLTGVVPVTPSLLRFNTSSFLLNPGLCGEILSKECHPTIPFFVPAVAAAPPPQNEQLQGVELTQPTPKTHRRTSPAVILGFSSGIFVLIGSIVCFVIAVNKHRKTKRVSMAADSAAAANAAVVMMIEEENELEEKVKRVQGLQVVGKSGSLVFCAGEAQLYTLDQLMRASAELLGRGTVGTTYKAVLDNRLIVCVKRLDAVRLEGTGREVFERHMDSVGGLRHPNLVPLRAYFQAQEERLLVYDYQSNGSLSSLIHGSKSARTKPLHWTSCLKIAEDVAQGLSYIHQAWRLVHGNLKSSNVLLGSDFEACLTDYCLTVLVTSPSHDDTDAASYRAPETGKPDHQATTSKSDVYTYGILLFELLTGKPLLPHPHLMPDDLTSWVRSTREENGGEDSQSVMLLEVAVACCATAPEQRPTMWQVLKMIQEIKEMSIMEEGELDLVTGTS